MNYGNGVSVAEAGSRHATIEYHHCIFAETDIKAYIKAKT
jgi:hypothetical protein